MTFLEWRNQIALAQDERIDPELSCGGIDGAFYDVAGLGLPGAAIGIGRCRICIDAARSGMDC
jgi:hypothetical protein